MALQAIYPHFVRSLIFQLFQPYQVIWLVFLSLFAVRAWQWYLRSVIPTVNAYPFDWMGRKARKAYNTQARSLVATGLAKFDGPFRIITTQGSRIILPSSYTDWAKTCKELDHQALVHDDFFADFSGFDGFAAVTNPDRIIIDVIKSKLSQNPRSIQLMHQHLADNLEDIWTDSQDWHQLDWPNDTMSIISRLAACAFVGPEMARDSEWQKLTTTYTVNVFQAVEALRQWPDFLRPLVHRILPQSETCRQQIKLARRKIQTVFEQREAERRAAEADGHSGSDHEEDMMTWLDEIAAGRPYDRAAAQLALAISALHTTSEAFRQVLLDLCLRPNLLKPMREEIEAAILHSGLSMAALAKMQLVDSIMKESQRFKSAIVGLERKVIRDTVLPNGTKLPRGSIISVDSSEMWSAEVHHHPDAYDGYRFLRMRQQGGRDSLIAPFVSSTRQHNTFGAGKFICPGRFFVANEMKIALAHVLLKYDFRLQDGQPPRNLETGFYPSTDLEVKVEVRRRECDFDMNSCM